MLILEILRKNRGSKDKTTIRGKSVVKSCPKPNEKAGTFITIDTLINLLKLLPEDELSLIESNGKPTVALPNRLKIKIQP